MKKYNVHLFVIGIVTLALLVIFNKSHSDKEMVAQIHRYKDASKEISKAIPSITIIDSSEHLSDDGLKFDFIISQEDAILNGLDTLNNLYTDKLIEELIIAEGGEIVFKLKESDNLDGREVSDEIHYSHYLSHNRVNFVEEDQIEIIERSTIEEWSYVVVAVKHK